MNVTDYIIDTSKDENEAMKKIADRAAAEHGKESVDYIVNNEQMSPDEAKTALINLSQTKNPTKESGAIGEIYKGMEYLGYGPAKLAAHVITPITEAVRSVPKYIAENVGENTSQTPPINTAAEYENPVGLPSSRAGTSLLMQDINNALGIKNQPIAKITSKDYPKAASFAENLTVPANIAGIATDVGMAKAIPTPNIPKLPSLSLEAAADYVRSITKDNSLLGDLEKSGKIYDIARMVQAEPEKYLHQFRPNKVYESIMGKVNPPEGSRLIGTGELAQMNRYQNDLIETIPRDVYSVPAEELQRSAVADLQSKGGLEAGQRSSAQGFVEKNIPISQPDINKMNKIRLAENAASQILEIRSNPNILGDPISVSKLSELEGVFKENYDPTMPTTEHYMDYIRQQNEMPIGQASELRRLGNKMMEPAIPGEVSTDIGAKNLAGRSIEKAARNAQEQAMGFMPPGEQSTYSAQNKKISDLLNLRNLMEGNLANAGGRSPYIPSGAGGTTGWAGAAAKAWDRYVKPTSQEMGSSLVNQVSGIAPGVTRYSSAASNIVNDLSSRTQLSNFQIPLNTSEIMNNPEIVYKKVSVEFGEKEADMLRMSSTPEQLRANLRLLQQQNPRVFSQTKYNNIDGYIDPAFKQQAINDIVKDKGSPSHNALRMETLLHDGRIIDE